MEQLKTNKTIKSPFCLFSLNSSTKLRSVITELGTNLPCFCALLNFKGKNKLNFIFKKSSLACHLHMPVLELCGRYRSGENNPVVLSGGTDAPDTTLNRNNCRLTPCRLPKAGLGSSSLFDILYQV